MEKFDVKNGCLLRYNGTSNVLDLTTLVVREIQPDAFPENAKPYVVRLRYFTYASATSTTEYLEKNLTFFAFMHYIDALDEGHRSRFVVHLNTHGDLKFVHSVYTEFDMLEMDFDDIIGTLSVVRVLYIEEASEISDELLYNCFSNLKNIILSGYNGTLNASTFAALNKLEMLDVINCDSYTTYDNVLFSSGMRELLFYPSGKKNLHYTLPVGCGKIACRAFYGVECLQELSCPSGVTFEYLALENCPKLRFICLYSANNHFDFKCINGKSMGSGFTLKAPPKCESACAYAVENGLIFQGIDNDRAFFEDREFGEKQYSDAVFLLKRKGIERLHVILTDDLKRLLISDSYETCLCETFEEGVVLLSRKFH